MQIISGKYKGRPIKFLSKVRPTQGKVRKAIFDIIRESILDAAFLELFAGCGAVGLEALSQGAKEVVFIDNNGSCIKTIRDNLKGLGLIDCAQPIPKDVFDAIKDLYENKRRFDIIFADPPYYQDYAKKTLKTISAYDILTPNGILIVQHFKKDNLPEKEDKLVLFQQKIYGDSVLSLYQKEG